MKIKVVSMGGDDGNVLTIHRVATLKMEEE